MKCFEIVSTCSFICCLILAVNSNPVRLVSKPFSINGQVQMEPLEAAASDDLPVMMIGDQFDMFVPLDHDHAPAESMQLQNFEKFTDMENNSPIMMESQFLPRSTAVRAPQPLSAQERRIRSTLEQADAQQERNIQRYLQKGATDPEAGAGSNQYEMFDYDSYSGNPGNDARYTRG